MVPDGLQKFHKKIVAESDKNFLLLPVRLILYFFSIPFALSSTIRAYLFKLGLKKSYKSKLHIISVGNIAVGGTGKTPFCIMLLEMLGQNGYKPSLVSRGYGKDESIIYQNRFPHLNIIFNPNRVTAVKQLELNQSENDIVVLDDAFQHQSIQRDKNILLIDATNPFGYGYFMPRGLLREGLKASNRADAIVFTHADQNKLNHYIDQFKPYTKQNCLFFSASHKINKIENNHRHCLHSADTKNKKIILISGIANPEKFEDTLSTALISFESHIKFGDHHSYQDKDFAMIEQQTKDCDFILTTEKDIVKFNDSWRNNPKVYTVYIHLTVHQSDEFQSYITAK